MHFTRMKRNGTTDSKYDKAGYVPLGGVKDNAPGRRGSLAVNIINDIKFKAGKRGKSWELTHQEAFDLIKSNCTYCGHKPNWPDSRVGIDRVNNHIGYTPSNTVPCCFTCNSAKGDKTHVEFMDWIEKIYNHMFKRATI